MAKFQESEDTCEFIRKVDTAFDLLNSRNPFAKGTKQPVTLEYLPDWAEECEKLATYLFNLKDDKGRLLRNGRCKTPDLGIYIQLTIHQGNNRRTINMHPSPIQVCINIQVLTGSS